MAQTVHFQAVLERLPGEALFSPAQCQMSPGRILKPKQDCVEKYFLSLYSNSQSRPVVSKRIPFAGEMFMQAAKGEWFSIRSLLLM